MRCPKCRQATITVGSSIQCVPCGYYWSARPYRKFWGLFEVGTNGYDAGFGAGGSADQLVSYRNHAVPLEPLFSE